MRFGLLIACTAFLATCAQPPTLLDEVLALGELRVVTRNSPTTYYIGADGPEGPEYDLVRGFADFLGVDLQVETADRFADLLPAVESGRAHIAAAGLTVTPRRARRVDFGPSYQEVRQYLIYKLGAGRPSSIEALQGGKLEIVAGTSYVETLRNVQAREPGLIFTENPNVDIADLLLSVSNGEIDYTVADSTLFDLYRNFVPEIRSAFDLTMADSLAWAFPKRHDDSLIRRAREYMNDIRSNGDLDRIMDRYYGHTERFDYVGTRRFMRDYRSKLPNYRALFERAAKATGMDWRLLAAIGYQESQWNPSAISPTGVRGIMMLTRDTAQFIGVGDRVDPAESISGGAAYLARMERRFATSIDEPDRTWFALAAYNVGYGHVQDARRLTSERGQDPNLWVHVKQSLPLLTQRKWHSQTRHGYARGWEPVMYVENIRNYYDIMTWLSSEDSSEPAGRDGGDANTIARIGIPPPSTEPTAL